MRWNEIAEGKVSKQPDRAPLRASEAELDRQAASETEAGIGVPVQEVAAWVASWDTADELPMPKARKVR